MMDWRLAHIWLRGRDDALRGVDRAQCYTHDARATYERGHAAGA